MALLLLAQSGTIVRDNSGGYWFQATATFNQNLGGINLSQANAVGGVIGNFGYAENNGTSTLVDTLVTGSVNSYYYVSGTNNTIIAGGVHLPNNQLTFGKYLGTVNPTTINHYGLIISPGMIKGADGTSYNGMLSLNASVPSYKASGNQTMDEGTVNNITLSTIGVAAGTLIDYAIAGIDPSRLSSHSLVGSTTVDINGNAVIPINVLNNNYTDGATNLTLSIASGRATYAVLVNDTSKSVALSPTYTIAGPQSINEGQTLNLTLNTTGLQSNTEIGYTISGISQSRVSQIFYPTSSPPAQIGVNSIVDSLHNNVYIQSNGSATITIPIVNNNYTDGPTTFTVSVANNALTYQVTVNDTSVSGAPIYSLLATSATINEGATNIVTLQTSNVVSGTSLAYTISGIAASRLSSGSLTGTVQVDGNGQAVIPFAVANNNHTDGPTTATITIGNNLATTTINIIDTSLTPGTTQVSLTPKTSYVVSTPNLVVNGTSDVDATIIAKTKAAVTINIAGSQATVIDNSGVLGTTTLNNVERLQLADTSVALDVGPTQNAGSVYMLYKAAFNRPSDPAGMGYWLAQKDGGKDIVTNLAQGFVNSPEFIAKYGANPSNADYVNKLYQNVLGRNGEAGGVTYWNQELDAGRISKAAVLVQFATLAEGASLVANEISHGIAYQQWVG